MFINIFIFSFSLLVSVLLLRRGFSFFEKYLLYKPNYRSAHKFPVPSGGGISFVFVSLIGSFYLVFQYGLVYKYLLPILCLPIAIVGFIDDFYNIRSIYRFIIQILSAILVLLCSPINFLPVNIYIFLFLIFIIVSIINFINFMDGADGLVGSSMCILFIIIISLTGNFTSLLFIVGSLIGFLFFNWHPAKIFMGDVGSTFLGLYFSGLLLQTDNLEISISLLLIASPLLIDSSFCVIRRLFAGQNPLKAHSLHLYQRLIKGGWSHRRVSLIYCMGIFLLSIIYFIFGLQFLIISVIIELIFGVYLDKKFAYPFFNKP